MWWLYILLSILLLVFLYTLRIPQQIKYRKIPGPRQLPFYGHRKNISKDPVDYELHLSDKYPTLMKRVVGGVFTVTANDFESFKKISSLPQKGIAYQKIFEKYREAALKYSIFNGTDQIWQDLRILMQPAFNLSSIKTYQPAIRHASDNQIVYIKQKEKQGELVDLFESTKMLTLTVIVNALFGVDLQSNNSQDEKRLHELSFVTSERLKATQRNFIINYLFYFPEFMSPLLALIGLTGAFEKVKEMDLAPGNKVLQIIQEKGGISDDDLKEVLERMNKGGGEVEESHLDTKQKGPGLLSKLLAIGKVEGHPLTQDQIASNLTILMIAGHDTTSLTLTFSIHSLSLNKDKEQKLLQEIDAWDKSKELTEESLSQFPYVSAVIHETLRLYSPVVSNFRYVKDRGVKAGGYEIPKDTTVILPIRAIHLSDRYYPKPTEYHPERWLPNPDPSIKPINPNAFVPFGYGPRQCIGMKLALVEAQIALIKFYQNFTFNIPKGGEHVELVNQFTMVPKQTIFVQPVSRN